MQIYQTLTINRGVFRRRLQVVAYELTLGQIIGIYFACQKLYFPDDAEKFALFMRKRIFSDDSLVRFNVDNPVLLPVEKILVENFFYQTNEAFFAKAGESKTDLPFFKGQEIYEDFVQMAWANPELVDYPFSVVKTMSENAKDWKREMNNG